MSNALLYLAFSCGVASRCLSIGACFSRFGRREARYWTALALTPANAWAYSGTGLLSPLLNILSGFAVYMSTRRASFSLLAMTGIAANGMVPPLKIALTALDAWFSPFTVALASSTAFMTSGEEATPLINFSRPKSLRFAMTAPLGCTKKSLIAMAWDVPLGLKFLGSALEIVSASFRGSSLLILLNNTLGLKVPVTEALSLKAPRWNSCMSIFCSGYCLAKNLRNSESLVDPRRETISSGVNLFSMKLIASCSPYTRPLPSCSDRVWTLPMKSLYFPAASLRNPIKPDNLSANSGFSFIISVAYFSIECSSISVSLSLRMEAMRFSPVEAVGETERFSMDLAI